MDKIATFEFPIEDKSMVFIVDVLPKVQDRLGRFEYPCQTRLSIGQVDIYLERITLTATPEDGADPGVFDRLREEAQWCWESILNDEWDEWRMAVVTSITEALNVFVGGEKVRKGGISVCPDEEV